MTAARRRRGPAHPGVVLLKPDPARRIGWRARFVNPDTGEVEKPSLDRALTTVELREEWAVRKSKALDKRRLELEGGAHRATGTALSDATDRYFKDHPQLRPKTLDVYKAAAGKLNTWAARARVRSADDLNGPRLMAFRAELIREPKRGRAKGGKRGAMKATNKPRSPHTINRELRSVRTILGYLRKLALLPRVSGDDLKDGLQRIAVGSERVDYRKPTELQKLLEAAMRHDADVFKATREEHAGKRAVGSTLRHVPIAPFVACVLLTGMRFGEVIELEWRQVDLDALDNEGRTVGEIHLSSATKTKKSRTIGLEVSPALRKLLAAMHLQSEKKGSVFKLTRDTANTALRRLQKEFGAPAGTGWQALRRTCGTYLTNAPGIFGAASAYRSAKQLGHSVQVAERHYVDVARGIPRDARALEAAMQIETQLAELLATRGAVSPQRRSA
ncbi:MAG TPA: tyrosine-type recombinase/integrase [Polyangiaceae bacterium]|nr:tyrosine-type recombinase/integrase [Polyangiaceae bacterium]